MLGNFNKFPTFIIMAALLFSFGPVFPKSEKTIGLVIHKKRLAYFVQRGRRADVKIAVRVEDLIRSGDILKTYDRSRISLQMRNGSIMQIAPRTLVRVDKLGRSGKSLRFKVNIGTVYARIQKRSGASVQIETPTAVASVRGTDVIVNVSKKQNRIVSRILVMNGLVEVTDLRTGRTMMVDHGYKARISDGRMQKARMQPKDTQKFRRIDQLEEIRVTDIARVIEERENIADRQEKRGEDTAEKEKAEKEVVIDLKDEVIQTEVNVEPVVEPLDLNSISPYK